jgi:hypothetical protein
MNKFTPTYAAALLALGSAQLCAAELSIEVQNLTHGMYFTPILAAAHSPDSYLFKTAEAASTELQMMAEGGDTSGLQTIVTVAAGDIAPIQGEDGLTAPASSKTFTLTNAAGNTQLSIVAMMLPTNDGFIGLNGWTIPAEVGTYTVYLNAYDAGTEANDELRGGGAPGTPGMPVPPPLDPIQGTAGSGVAGADTNATVHIHRGNIGDDSMTGGTSDVINTVHRWLNPVAKVTVTVN